MTNYSNPRMQATIPDWPSGSRRVTAKLWIEQVPKRGERAVRETTGVPKKLTYAKRVRIVDGDDGRTYVLELATYSAHITVMRGSMNYTYETISEREDAVRYAEMLALFN
jgi:hypothetical protein